MAPTTLTVAMRPDLATPPQQWKREHLVGWLTPPGLVDAYRLAAGRTEVASQLSCPLCRSPLASHAPLGRCFAQPHGELEREQLELRI